MAVIDGRCVFTGAALQVHYDDHGITAIHRHDSADPSLPFLVPGLIDVQVNGYAGWDVNGEEATADAVIEITRALATRGVTRWVPTIITASEESISASLRAVRQAREADDSTRHAIPFCHVEGPFISAQDGPRGAHPAEHIRPVDAAEVARWAAHGPLGYVTLSPHTDESPAEISRIIRSGVAVAIGHTEATPEQVTAAVDAGATLSTHLGNGIFPTLPRHPNAIWTQLADDRLLCGFIGDGHHLSAQTLTAMVRATGVHRAFLVSDSAALAGSAPGVYETPVGGKVELHADGKLSLVGSPLLAGSGVDLAAVLSFVVNETPLGLREAVLMAAITPRRVLGEQPRPGLQVGDRADLVLLSHAGEVLQSVQQGRTV